MRCSCARSSLAALLVPPILLGCASAPPAPVADRTFHLEGTLNVEGPDPFGRSMALVDGEGMVWRLDPGALEHELSLLGGHTIRIVCRGLSERGESVVSVSQYELLPVDGREPVYGILKADPGSMRVDSDGISIRLGGPLAEALAGFDGHAVWVWGERGHRGTMSVEGYVVMGRVLTAPNDH